MPTKPAKLLRRQAPMERVLLALLPLVVASVYWFGWRALILLAVINAAAFLTEYTFCRIWKQPVSEAVFVTGTLYTLSLTPTLPYWMALVGIVFAITFGKMVFGGFGKNVFNPALTGRAFVYICFGGYMTASWYEPAHGLLGGLIRYAPDAVTGATPGMLLKEGTAVSAAALFAGNISGTIGGTSALLAILGGCYLLWKKTANYRIVAPCLVGYLIMQTVLWIGGATMVDPLHGILAGSFMIGAFFYATDPVSASQTNEGRWIYGAFIGVMSSVITVFSAWPAGTMFSILLANMFAPIMDHGIKSLKSRKQFA